MRKTDNSTGYMDVSRFYLYSTMLMILVFGTAAVPVRAAGGSGFRIDHTDFDAGVVVEGVVLSHCFTMKNTGEIPLKILRVIPDCGCTGVEFDSTIPPARSGTLRVTFNTLDETGRQVKAVKIYSSDSGNPVTTVRIAAHVLEAVSVVPDRVFFSGLTGRSQEKKIRISTPGSTPLDLTVEKKMLPPGIDFCLEKNAVSFLAVFKNRAPAPGIFRGRVILKTRLAPRPYITIPVLARVYDPVEVLPGTLDFGKVSRENIRAGIVSPPVRQIRIICHTARNFKITSMEISGPAAFSAKIHRPGKTGDCRIDVFPTVSPESSPGRQTAHLKIHTNIDGFSTIDIPVSMDLL